MVYHRQRKVLLMEADPIMAGRICTYLKYLGYQVEVKGCAYEGMQTAATMQPDVVICSTGLPGMNGFQVAKHLRENTGTTAIRLIGVMDFSSSSLNNLSCQSCFDLHLFRPLTIAKLREALEPAELLQQASPAADHWRRLLPEHGWPGGHEPCL